MAREELIITDECFQRLVYVNNYESPEYTQKTVRLASALPLASLRSNLLCGEFAPEHGDDGGRIGFAAAGFHDGAPEGVDEETLARFGRFSLSVGQQPHGSKSGPVMNLQGLKYVFEMLSYGFR